MVALLIAVLITYTAAFLAVLHLVLRHLAGRDTAATAERAAHRDELATLLQRIQAPDVAVYQHDQVPEDPMPKFPLDDEGLAKLQEQERVEALTRVQEIEAEMAVL